MALLLQRTLQMFCFLPHCTDFTKAFFYFKSATGLQGWDVPQSRSVAHQRKDKAPSSAENRIAIHRTGPCIAQCLHRPQCAAFPLRKAWSRDWRHLFCFDRIHYEFICMYVCLFQVNSRTEWESLVDHFCLPKHCANCGVGLKQIYLRSAFLRITIEKPKRVVV